jgi:predicted nucleic acid-binding protein
MIGVVQVHCGNGASYDTPDEDLPSVKPTVYIETTVVSYLTAWPSRDLVRLAQQVLTREWWDGERANFELFTSQFVMDEAGAGDPVAAGERLAVLRTLPLLEITDDVEPLATRLVATGAVPSKAKADAQHLAVAAAAGIDYLCTWNCRHLANMTMRGKIEAACREFGFEPPIIGTPAELNGGVT